jgi:hypothetical protein
MSVAVLLRAAIAVLQLQGHDPARLRDDGSVKTFARILGCGAQTWALVDEAVTATPPDFELASQLLETRLTFEDTGRNEYIRSFEQDVRIAADSRALGHSLAIDAFLLVVGPLRPALFRVEEDPRVAIDGVLSDTSELATLPRHIEVLRNRASRGRTSWGKRRLQRRAEHLDVRVADIATTSTERVERAQQRVTQFVFDVAMTVALFEATFSVDCHRLSGLHWTGKDNDQRDRRSERDGGRGLNQAPR